MDLRILRRLAYGFSLLYAVLLWSVVSANDTPIDHPSAIVTDQFAADCDEGKL